MKQTEIVQPTPTTSNTHQVESTGKTIVPNRKRNRRRRLPSW
ncbi:MAG: hypothetical protein ACXVCY_02170 [Pseudobdellovibrionaceae bacterium]